MARPSLTDILSSLQSWDATVNDNFSALVDAPFPIIYAASSSALTTNHPPSQYDACVAVVWDGTPGNNANLYISNGSAWVDPVAAPTTGFINVNDMLHVRDEKTSGTAGQSFGSTGTWLTRDMNTVKVNTITGASLATNQITLPAGDYIPFGSFSTYSCANSRTRLQNITDTTTVDYGLSGQDNNNDLFNIQTPFFGQKFTIASSKVFEFQTIVSATGSAGTASSQATEIYSDSYFFKVG